MPGIAIRLYVKVRGKDAYRERTPKELQAAARKRQAVIDRKRRAIRVVK